MVREIATTTHITITITITIAKWPYQSEAPVGAPAPTTGTGTNSHPFLRHCSCVPVTYVRADVVNRGFGGYSSRMGLFVLDEFLNSFGPGRIKLVTLGFGANDAAVRNGHSGYLTVPLPEYRANLAAMIAKLRSKGVAGILLITPTPILDAVS
jgi:hypothetical protein